MIRGGRSRNFTIGQTVTESEVQALVNDHGEFVSVLLPNGSSHILTWGDLIRVEIQTNDSGPWGWDVWFVLVGAVDEVSFPLGAAGQEEVFEKLQAVTGKSHEQLIDGMNCTTNKTFVTWEKR